MPAEQRMHEAETRRSDRIEAKCAERDELLRWLGELEGEGAAPESAAVVRAQLERVLHQIARLKVAEVVGFSLPASADR